ncbi:hypothetical protein LIER_34253 [Lithospermum erythrorhizon]|uniref:Uncharacterized protein n=1 Tax=Lithospermum erythrorhizon TaxID=34254 RepID=A0AAV3S247_LITER
MSFRISTKDSKDTTILLVHAYLYKGMSIGWDSIPDIEVGGHMDWSPYASGSCYCLTYYGNPEPETPHNQRFLKDDVATGRAS